MIVVIPLDMWSLVRANALRSLSSTELIVLKLYIIFCLKIVYHLYLDYLEFPLVMDMHVSNLSRFVRVYFL